MFQISTARAGVLTNAMISCPDAESAAALHKIICATFGGVVSLAGSKIEVSRLNKRELLRVLDAVEQFKQSHSAEGGPVAPQGEPAPRYRHRELVLANSPVKPRPEIITADGEVLRFAGFGREFVAGEIHGPNWGDLVRYAYYT
jgi:hypothetical protein